MTRSQQLVLLLSFVCLNTSCTFRDALQEVHRDNTLLEFIQETISLKLNLEESVIPLLNTMTRDDSMIEEIKPIYTDLQTKFREVRGNYKEYSKVIYDMFKPTEHQKKMYAEIPTPSDLKQEMLDKVPNHMWRNKNNKIL